MQRCGDFERFFITDINNPVGGAHAQSTLVTMFDLVSTNVAEYNHVLGGSNVLYKDSHVRFVRYPGDRPCIRIFASLVPGF